MSDPLIALTATIKHAAQAFRDGNVDQAREAIEYADATLENPRPEMAPEVDDRAQLWAAAAMASGCNDLARQAPTLGQKVYFRIMRDCAEAEFIRLGGHKFIKSDEAIILELPDTMPHVAFRPSDITLMKAAIQDFEADETTGGNGGTHA